MTNETGWIYKTVSQGGECLTKIRWSSTENGISTGPGVLSITVNGTQKYLNSVEQGVFSKDIGEYLAAGSNTVRFVITDIYGNSKTVNMSVTCVALTISSTFDNTVAFSGEIAFPYTPVGAASKTVHFILDGCDVRICGGSSTVPLCVSLLKKMR